MANSLPSITLFGSLSRLTCFTLEEIIRRELPVKNLVIDGFGPADPHQNQPFINIVQSQQNSVLNLCAANGIPFHFAPSTDEILANASSTLRGDIFLLCCYPKLLPVEIVKQADIACINVHPSKLPKYRGPNPIFWQLRQNETNTGISLHLVVAKFDAGEILMFKPVKFTVGSRLHEIERKLASSAVDCLVKLIWQPKNQWRPIAQNHANASWYPMPCAEDFAISTSLNAKLAYSFIRAYARTTRPITVHDHSKIYYVIDAVGTGIGQKPQQNKLHSDRFVRNLAFNDGNIDVLLSNNFPPFGIEKSQ